MREGARCARMVACSSTTRRRASPHPAKSAYTPPCRANVCDLWPSLMHAIETELCRITGDVDEISIAEARFAGKARGVSTAMKLAMPMRAIASIGMVDLVSYALMWLGHRVHELVAIWSKLDAGTLDLDAMALHHEKDPSKGWAGRPSPTDCRRMGGHHVGLATESPKGRHRSSATRFPCGARAGRREEGGGG